MVKRRLIPLLCLLAINALHLQAQNYSATDTVTEYPNKGTFYHDMFEGRKTASGEVFDQNKFTAAHWKIKLGTYVMVTNQNTGLQVIVRVNDRCPKRGVFDMSHRAAAAIGIRGMQPVTIRILPDGYEDTWAAQEMMFDSVRSRLNPNVTSPPPSLVKSSATNPDTKVSGKKYNLLLGIAKTHGEVYTQIRRLPAEYRDRVNVEPLEGSDSLNISLVLNQTKRKADQLARSLRNTFPSVRVIPSE